MYRLLLQCVDVFMRVKGLCRFALILHTFGATGLVSCRMKSERLLVLIAARGEVGGASRIMRSTGRYTSLKLNRQFLKIA